MSTSSAASPAIEQCCPQCGYSLCGLTSANCPECGHDVDQYLRGESKIPWLRVRGWRHWGAFWATAFLLTFRGPRLLRFDLFRETDYRHTRAFAWLAALHAWAALVLLGLYVVLAAGKSPLRELEKFTATTIIL